MVSSSCLRAQASESRYVRRVKALVNAYLVPLQSSQLLSGAETAAIFHGLTDIRDVHAKLNTVIQAASEDDNVGSGVAAVANEFMM
jgi:hypothetical protein